MSSERLVESTLRVRYAETDAMGIVYHANYLVWFEVGRGDFFRSLGLDNDEWEERGVFLPVSEAYARYLSPAGYGDLIVVRTRLDETRSRSVKLSYVVCDVASQRPLASGWTKHLCVDREGRMRRLPEDLYRALEKQ